MAPQRLSVESNPSCQGIKTLVLGKVSSLQETESDPNNLSFRLLRVHFTWILPGYLLGIRELMNVRVAMHAMNLGDAESSSTLLVG